MIYKTRWAASSGKEKLFLVSCIVLAGVVSLLLIATQPKPLDRTAFLNGCLKTGSRNVPAETLAAYCQCSAEGVTPEILASSRTDKPALTPEIRALAQSCARKVGLAGTE